jgi:hypothetical protein
MTAQEFHQKLLPITNIYVIVISGFSLISFVALLIYILTKSKKGNIKLIILVSCMVIASASDFIAVLLVIKKGI